MALAEGSASGQFYAPSRLPFANAAAHFLADADPRVPYASLNAPGGELGVRVLPCCGSVLPVRSFVRLPTRQALLLVLTVAEQLMGGLPLQLPEVQAALSAYAAVRELAVSYRCQLPLPLPLFPCLTQALVARRPELRGMVSTRCSTCLRTAARCCAWLPPRACTSRKSRPRRQSGRP